LLVTEPGHERPGGAPAQASRHHPGASPGGRSGSMDGAQASRRGSTIRRADGAATTDAIEL